MAKIAAVVAYTLRPAGAEDAEALFRIHRAAMGEHLARALGPLTDESERQQHANWLRAGRAQVVVVGGQTAGGLDVEWLSDLVRLNRIEIDPAFQGRGLGTAIINELCSQCRQRRLPIRLHVFPGNPARRLYRRLGFRELGPDGPSLEMQWHPGEDTAVPC